MGPPGSAVGFLMTAWVLPDSTIEWADSGTSRLMRMPEFDQYGLSLVDLPMVLNVFSDGTLLITDQGYESFSITLYRYSADEPKETGVTYGYGC